MLKSLVRPLLAGTILVSTAMAASAVTYVRGNDGDPETLDQHKTSLVAEAHLMRDLYEGLVVYDANAKIIPGVAEEWSVSDDGTVYTFNLRDDAKWSNGDPVVAEDFVFSLRRIMMPDTGAKYANILYPIKNAEAINKGEMEADQMGVKAVDDRTLEITLEQPTPFFLELLTHQTGLPVNPKAVEAHGTDFVQPENIVTNGAYKLVSFTPGDKIVMEKNENFHDADNVQIDTIEYIPFEDRATCVRRFEAGEVQSCSDLPTEQIKSMKERLGDQVRISPYLGTYYYSLNMKRDVMSDPKVRQALAMVIDREFLGDEIWAGAMLPAYSLVPPGIGNYEGGGSPAEWADMSLLDREDKAIELMTEAGYGPDNPVTVELAYNNSENHKNTATAIADMWKPLGVNVEFNVRDLSAHYANLRDQKDFDVARAGWIGDYSDPQNFLFLVESDNTGFNYAQYENPDYDALMDKAAAETDLVKRAEILREAEATFMADMPYIPLLFYSSLSLVSPKLNGWEDNIQNVHGTRFMSISE
ncbi:peptide ABC transporter substrate-binding protein [Nitratireductor aquimarinus]|uniref:Peptide ABC transporter substrate-binding protein n=1 Tax=Nitratireductor aquimarinus TaxID=889300 RepID=A0ABU4AR55_9HYPH|nr:MULTISPECIES: peptide ABC transporter substrate-binding protein [Alphaproteobacteria]MBY6024402.1 peptide ABC transporter substrate-binding protein [Nitratireductor sp. DP7N14-4]MBN7759136.1 peptide ABC transporter substrate-binding protein [Nitratireductor aquimarinus]MBN7761382.1 peptide ABC transporter substrate-binding protein [Nitratireductor aquibiodomus]MBY6001997.1 peptide ABC transporter substrate-binding protein [Tritonibacter mobilis]MCV0379936.1 peptide ABC transporter substrate